MCNIPVAITNKEISFFYLFINLIHKKSPLCECSRDESLIYAQKTIFIFDIPHNAVRIHLIYINSDSPITRFPWKGGIN